MKRGHCFYVMACGDTHYRKLGVCSSDLMVRLRNAQTANALPIVYLQILSFDTRTVSEAFECLCLGALRHMSSKPCLGEWTHLTEPDELFLRRIDALAGQFGYEYKIVLRQARAVSLENQP